MGDEGDVAALIEPGTPVADALGHRVIPGLNDSHIHLIRGGVNYLLELRWDGCRRGAKPPPGGNSRSVTAELALPLGPRDVGYARVSSSTGIVRTPAVWRAYSAKPGYRRACSA